MDDIWSAEVCDDVWKLFPDNHNGSRIILTTRLIEVATYAATGQKIHMMRFLDDEQSWRLFHHKPSLKIMTSVPHELIKLWIAEGFMEWQNESERVEVVAEGWLEELINQSLVLITSWKIDGKIKSCRLHSMVRDFCVRQAGHEKFLLPVMDYFPTPILRKHFLPQVLQNHPRISVSWHDLHLRDSIHSLSTTSIICIPQRGYRPKGSVENFTSLRVLHVLRRNDRSYWELGQVFELIYLTYLASNIPDSIVPPAIAKLQNLQTLIIYRFDVRLPVEIWSLRQLRNLIAFSFQPLPLPKGEAPLKSLAT
ncbi:putative late blight resistance protein homolog R1B-17 [Salvia hispanica]|uniref:putative late blight resistance protein homolog R1B-17 n=1 Tax=Salvia hispanica TaxID=49212 RepID=UPI00200935AF|nr:putative late blight resistance protein homolog R1B-17 [Salvia hispanica]